MTSKRLIAFIAIAFQIILCPAIVYSDTNYLEQYSKEIEREILSQVKLLNDIIQNPQAASMANLERLKDPHDESELRFYMNSISNGTVSSYQKGSSTQERLISHSRSISASEKSVLLEHLRLSLMAFDLRPGAEVPEIKISSISTFRSESSEVVAKGNLMAHDASGDFIPLPAMIIFVIKPEESGVKAYLLKLIIADKEIYGWWYQI